MTIGYDIEVLGLDEQLSKLVAYDEISNRHMRAAMQKGLITIGSEVLPLVPVGVSSRLKNSMGSEIQELGPGNLVGRYGSSLKDEEYPAVMEFGRRPGAKMPPVDALVRWVHLKIRPGEEYERGVAFAIACKIGREGIKGKRFMRKGFEKAKERVIKFFVAALDEIAEDLSNGR